MKRIVRFAFVLSILVMFASLGNEAWGQRRVSSSSNHASENVRSNAGGESKSAAISRSANVSRSSASNTGRSNSAAGRSGSAEIRKAPSAANHAASNMSRGSNNVNVNRNASNMSHSNANVNVNHGASNISHSNANVNVNRNANAGRPEMHVSNNGKSEMHVSSKDLNHMAAGRPAEHHSGHMSGHNAVNMNNHMNSRSDMAHWHHPYVNDRPMVAAYHRGHHNYGYRIHEIPFGARIIRYRGHKYYSYGGVWYRRYRGDYIIVRPPYGERIAMAMFNYNLAHIWVNNVINDIRMIERAAELSRAYASVNSNYVVRNANDMNYASKNADYYYNDGVFYVLDGNEYVVIEAPIGALVSEIPEDYEEIVVGNEVFYKVDNVLFKTSVVDGAVYFEVASNL